MREDGILLKWGVPTFAGDPPFDSYFIYRDYMLLKVVPRYINEYLDTDVEVGKEYEYYVVASNRWGTSLISNSVSVVYRRVK